MFYRQLRHGVSENNYKLIPTSENVFFKYIKKNPSTEHYTSIYKYNEEQYNKFLETHSIKNIKDVVTDLLVFDFDSDDLEKAKLDAIEICYRLINHDVPEQGIKISFSGNKGFHVEVKHNIDLSVTEFKAIVKQLANGLETFDSKVCDHARIFRALGSINKKSSLYKIPLTLEDLNSLTIDEIKEKAKDLAQFESSVFNYKHILLPEAILNLKNFKEEYKPVVETIELKDIDWSIKPKNMSNCRYTLQNGYFKESQRNNAFLCLAATYKNQGLLFDHTYRLLKGVAEVQAKRNNCERYPDNELFNNITTQVYGEGWGGGQFTCRKQDNWLYEYCQSLGEHKCNHKDEDAIVPKKLTDIHETFKNYVVNIEKNTIKTGIPSLDKAIFLSTGANVGIIGSAGSGKTSLALDIVSNTSKMGVNSVLASLDMHYNRLFEKALYRVSGLSREQLYGKFKNNEEQELLDKLEKEFGNVNFFHKSCPTVQDLKDYILACQEQSGQKVKLVVLDYFERITSDFADDTAASKRVAGELQDLVNDLDICLITLVQPNKMSISGGPDSPILNYTNIKGSSYVYQSFRIILSLWRPFYGTPEKDNYMQMAVLKNDLGELSQMNFAWHGKTGKIHELGDSTELDEWLKEKHSQEDETKKW